MTIAARFLPVWIGCLVATSALAQPIDFTTFTVEEFPLTTGSRVVYETTPTSATMQNGLNPTPSVFYGPDDIINRRIRGFMTPSSVGPADDDFLGFVLGFRPGDATLGGDSANADYLMIDWKGADQTVDIGDPEGVPAFHDLTTGSFFSPAGVAVSRVRGVPNNDEQWGHVDAPENSSGGVTEIARGATLGTTGYNREQGARIEFDIIYIPDRLEIRIDGSLEFDLTPQDFGYTTFPEGRFGLFNAWQSEAAQFSDFQILPPFPPLKLEVDPSTGFARVVAVGEEPLELRSYAISAEQGVLTDEAWDATNLARRGVDSAEGVGSSWQTINAGSDQVFESFLLGGTSLAPGESLVIGQIIEPVAEGEPLPDLVFDFAVGEPGGSEAAAPNFGANVEFVDLVEFDPFDFGDFNRDGVNDAIDYTLWRDGLGVDFGPEDYGVWAANYGRTWPASALAVPEPSALVCLAVLAVPALRVSR